ncbi:MAG: hypothetical protein H0Z38_08945 [Firmicutes bacterium]|nr:hypothetical protein [Bacillota bacterium]
MVRMQTAAFNLLALALFTEVLTNMVKNIFPDLTGIYSNLVSGIFGMAICFGSGTGFFKLMEIPLNPPVVDYFLTGLIVARGSNFVHNILDTLKPVAPARFMARFRRK